MSEWGQKKSSFDWRLQFTICFNVFQVEEVTQAPGYSKCYFELAWLVSQAFTAAFSLLADANVLQMYFVQMYLY